MLLAPSAEIGVADLPPAVIAANGNHGQPFTTDVLPVRELTRRYAVWALEQLGGVMSLTVSWTSRASCQVRSVRTGGHVTGA